MVANSVGQSSGIGAVLTADSQIFKLLGEKLYHSDPTVIAVRELLQNSRDAVIRAGSASAEDDPSVHFDLNRGVDDQGENYNEIVCTDLGVGMGINEIVNDFLCLGGTSKRGDQDSVGGFGVAKCSLFRADYWSVSTNDHYLDSDILAAGGDIRVLDHSIKGTVVTVRFLTPRESGIAFDVLLDSLSMLWFSDVRVSVFIDWAGIKSSYSAMGWDGVALSLDSGDYGDYTVYGLNPIVLDFPGLEVTREFNKLKVYRLNGLVQFTDRIRQSEINKVLIIDIRSSCDPSDGAYPFTMSRESLDGRAWYDVQESIDGIMRDWISTTIKIDQGGDDYKSPRLLGAGRALVSGVGPGPHGHAARVLRLDDIEGLINQLAKIGDLTRRRRGHAARLFDQDSEICGFKVVLDGSYKGDPKVGDLKVLLIWAYILSLVSSEDFAIGLTGESCVVGKRGSFEGDPCYYINPDHFVDLDRSALPFAIWHLAIHEVSHGKESFHNEGFASCEGSLSRASAESFYRGLSVCRQLIRRKLV